MGNQNNIARISVTAKQSGHLDKRRGPAHGCQSTGHWQLGNVGPTRRRSADKSHCFLFLQLVQHDVRHAAGAAHLRSPSLLTLDGTTMACRNGMAMAGTTAIDAAGGNYAPRSLFQILWSHKRSLAFRALVTRPLCTDPRLGPARIPAKTNFLCRRAFV